MPWQSLGIHDEKPNQPGVRYSIVRRNGQVRYEWKQFVDDEGRNRGKERDEQNAAKNKARKDLLDGGYYTRDDLDRFEREGRDLETIRDRETTRNTRTGGTGGGETGTGPVGVRGVGDTARRFAAGLPTGDTGPDRSGSPSAEVLSGLHPTYYVVRNGQLARATMGEAARATPDTLYRTDGVNWFYGSGALATRDLQRSGVIEQPSVDTGGGETGTGRGGGGGNLGPGFDPVTGRTGLEPGREQARGPNNAPVRGPDTPGGILEGIRGTGDPADTGLADPYFLRSGDFYDRRDDYRDALALNPMFSGGSNAIREWMDDLFNIQNAQYLARAVTDPSGVGTFRDFITRGEMLGADDWASQLNQIVSGFQAGTPRFNAPGFGDMFQYILGGALGHQDQSPITAQLRQGWLGNRLSAGRGRDLNFNPLQDFIANRGLYGV